MRNRRNKPDLSRHTRKTKQVRDRRKRLKLISQEQKKIEQKLYQTEYSLSGMLQFYGRQINRIDEVAEKSPMSQRKVTMASQDCSPMQITIKQEDTLVNEEQYVTMDIKIEEDTSLRPENSINDQDENVIDNPFENFQLEIKQEDLVKDNSNFNTVLSQSSKKNLQVDIHHSITGDNASTNAQIQIKEETQMDEPLVSYDFPNFDDTSQDDGSMGSNEAVALGNVEACLQDEITIKCENEGATEVHRREAFPSADVKMEADMPLTEGHMASEVSLTNIYQEINGLPKTIIVMKVPRKRKIVNDEAILPTSYNNDIRHQLEDLQQNSGNIPSLEEVNESDGGLDSFQLNSITGNILSLEQEAYGLLKAKRKSTKLGRQRSFLCPECPKAYYSEKNLNYHLSVHRTIERRAMGVIRGQKTRKENQKKKLKSTNYEYVSKDPKPNKSAKKEGYECTCGKVFQRRSRMETCLRSHNLFEEHTNCVSCATCTKKFKNKDELSHHRKRLHRKKFPCKFCPTDYDTRKELFKHLQIHQKVQLMEYKVISEVMNGKKKLRCFICSKRWSELAELKIHVMNVHKGPYICPHCKNTFPTIVDFGNHTKMIHPEVENQSVLDVLEAFSRLVKAWKCEECELQFLEADKLALHQIEKHSVSPDVKSELQFQCTDCRRVFISQKGLTSHRRIHHSVENTEVAKEEETGIMCLECRKICKDMTALTSHMRLHSPDRKYPCKFCDFRFATQEKRKTHADIHTGDMKYVCFICEYQCSSENRLKHHKMSLKHVNMREYLLTGKPLIEPESSNVKQEKIKNVSKKKEKDKCSDKKKKRDSEEKREEVEKKDNNNDSDSSSSSVCDVSCDICGEKFTSETIMLEHKQTHPFIEFPNDDKPSRIFFK